MAKPFDPDLQPQELAAGLPGYADIVSWDEGGQGCVFRAVHPGGQLVAVKVFNPDKMVWRGRLEAEKLSRLTSPYVVKLVEHGEIPLRGQACFYIATRFEKGLDLRRVLAQRNQLTEAEVRNLICDMSTAIDELWQLQVVHCDIKPANILLGADGCFRLVDLGFAKHLDVATQTEPGARFGTWGYMAPEQMVQRKNLTLRTDLFALGVVAYEALTGQHPFARNQMLIGTPFRPQAPSTLVQVSPEVEGVIGELMRPQVLLRPQSGAAVVRFLGGRR